MLSALLLSEMIGEIVINKNLLKIKLKILTKVKAQHPYL